MSTLVLRTLLPRFAAARGRLVIGFGARRRGRPLAAGGGRRPPALPGPGGCTSTPLLSGICGSDLATLDGRSSRYFEDIVSFPFVPGHEVVGTLTEDASGADGAGWPPGAGSCSQPVLGCAARGIEPPVPRLPGRTGGQLRPPGLRPHPARAPDRVLRRHGWRLVERGPRRALEPALRRARRPQRPRRGDGRAGGLRRACRSGRPLAAGDVVALIGAGTLGLPVTAALSHLAATGRCPEPSAVLVGARYGHQQRLARELGCTEALPPDQLARAVRRHARSFRTGATPGRRRRSRAAPTSSSTAWAAPSRLGTLAMVRPAGHGGARRHAGPGTVDLAPLWHREVRLAGAYAYGTERGRTTESRRPPSTWPSKWPRPIGPGAWCRPPTRSPASRTRWRTPARPGGAAP